MYFLIENDDLLEKHNAIWDKVSTYIKKHLISSLSLIQIFGKLKQNLYSDEIKDFYDKEIPKVDPNYTCLAVNSSDSAHNKDGKYYP